MNDKTTKVCAHCENPNIVCRCLNCERQYCALCADIRVGIVDPVFAESCMYCKEVSEDE